MEKSHYGVGLNIFFLLLPATKAFSTAWENVSFEHCFEA